MKKIILLLLISGGLTAQVVVPKSTTTFSNIVATGSETVTGNLKVGGAITSPTVYGSSAAGGILNLFGTSSATPGIVNVGMSTGTTQINSLTNITNSLTVGSAVSQSSLANFYVNKGTSTVIVGEPANGYGGFWINPIATPSATNYVVATNTSQTLFNDANGVDLELRISNVTKLRCGQNGVRIGSSTAPSATLDVTGTMSVSGTSTLTGVAKLTNTLNYVGNTTWNTNQTNTLTTGNTGTVAVLSDAVFPVQFTQTGGNPADATTYYCYSIPYNTMQSATFATIGRHYLPYNCTLVGWSWSNINNSIDGSAESLTVSVRANNSTDTQLSSSITMSTSLTYTATGLNTNFTAGDLINIKIQCPTWVTNPQAVFLSVTLWFVRRQ